MDIQKAAALGNTEQVRALLLEAGTEVNAKAEDGFALLHCIAYKARLPCVARPGD